ncbi:MAG: hypothetical protein AAF430_10985 [Myxococcota bacterium]
MKRVALAIGVFLTAAGIGFVSVERAREQWIVIEACEAAQQGRIEHALALTEERVGSDDTGRAAGECRCHALLRAGDTEACIALLETLVDDPEDWIPQPGLSDLLLQRWGEVGRHEEARSLAISLARAHPEEPFLLQRELEARVVLEPEAKVLADLQSRLPERGNAAARTRVLIAQRHLMRGDAPSAIALLSGPFPPEAENALGLWHDTLGTAHAMNDDLPGTQRAYDAWRAAGGDPAEISARYLLALSTSGLHDTEIDLLAAFRTALADPRIQADAALAESLAVRLLYTLVAADRAQEALATYDALAGHVPLDGVSRDEIERADLGRRLSEAPEEARAGRLQFTLPAELAGGTLLVSPAPGAAPDADYEARGIQAGVQIRVERPLALAPTRWVARDREGHTRASGTLVPRPGDTLGVRVETMASAPSPPDVPERARGRDGRRRVALLLLDCGDWAISQYLRTRGDLPVWDSLLAGGHRAVLDSDPPLTAAALEALVWPGRRNETSLVGTVYRYGVELAGLESIGTNPFEPLGWFLPESRDLFETLGAGELRVANLLLAHGGVRAGRHGIVTGPEGRTEALALGASRRPLRADERARFPTLASLDGSDLHHVETIAAEFDAAESLLREGRLDVLAMRIEPLDLLTHAHFGEAVRAGQDDGNALLFSVYRYIDGRLGALLPTLDADDVLIVASDHGIRTAMEHDRPALFVAQGEGVPVGRAPGQPNLRGMARVIANLTQVETDWPETGIALWSGETRVAEGDASPEPDEG